MTRLPSGFLWVHCPPSASQIWDPLAPQSETVGPAARRVWALCGHYGQSLSPWSSLNRMRPTHEPDQGTGWAGAAREAWRREGACGSDREGGGEPEGRVRATRLRRSLLRATQGGPACGLRESTALGIPRPEPPPHSVVDSLGGHRPVTSPR